MSENKLEDCRCIAGDDSELIQSALRNEIAKVEELIKPIPDTFKIKISLMKYIADLKEVAKKVKNTPYC